MLKPSDHLLLRRIRATLGMTQRQFAEALDIGESTVSAHERGALPVPRERLMAALLLALVRLDRARREQARLRRPFG